jgi:hypothetical protein
MSAYRFEIDCTAGPAREGILYGRAMLLVRVRLFDGPGVVDSVTGQEVHTEDVYSDLRPDDARRLAFRLLEAAAHAERITEQHGWWAPEMRR